MAAARYDFTIEAGATFSRVFTYRNADGSSAISAGSTAQIQLRRTADAASPALTSNPTVTAGTGTISFTLTAAQTGPLSGTYVWALELTASGGEPVVRVAEGRVTVSAEVVR